MSTDYTIYEEWDEATEKGIDVSFSSRQTLDVTIDGEFRSSKRLTEDELVDCVVGFFGPLFYFTDNEEELAEKFKRKLHERGFTYVFDKKP